MSEPSAHAPHAAASPPASRHLVLARRVRGLVVLGAVGVAAELALTEHYEEWKQVVPLAVLGLFLAAELWGAVAPGRGASRARSLLLLAFVVAGLSGLVLHFRSNLEFQEELHPDLGAGRLFLASIRATSPPALAPGVLILLGCLGLVARGGAE